MAAAPSGSPALPAYPRSRDPAVERGFSLAEMLVVIAILGLTAGIGMVVLDLSRNDAAAAASRVASELSLARSRAVFEGNDFVISFNLTTSRSSFLIHDDMNNNGTLDTGIGETSVSFDLTGPRHEVVLAITPGLRGVDGSTLTDAVTFPGTPPSTTFSARSRATEGAIYLIPKDDLAVNDPSHMRAITVSGATGKIRRWRYDPDSSGPGPWRLAL